MKKKQSTTDKPYKITGEENNIVNEPMFAYATHNQLLDVRTMSLLAHQSNNNITHDLDLIKFIRDGITKKSLDHLLSIIGYSINDIASVLHVSDRNLRRYTTKDKLSTEQSERLVEIAKLYAKGENVFGSIDLFNDWMNSDILSLGNQSPKSYLDTSLGIQLIMKELGRIEHGIFA